MLQQTDTTASNNTTIYNTAQEAHNFIFTDVLFLLLKFIEQFVATCNWVTSNCVIILSFNFFFYQLKKKREDEQEKKKENDELFCVKVMLQCPEKLAKLTAEIVVFCDSNCWQIRQLFNSNKSGSRLLLSCNLGYCKNLNSLSAIQRLLIAFSLVLVG